jgi:hypothetical protein
MDELEKIDGKIFGPQETVVLDGRHFVGCTFDGCEISYSGGDFGNEANTYERPCSLVFYGAAHRTRLVLELAGYRITSPFGQQPQTKLPQ